MSLERGGIDNYIDFSRLTPRRILRLNSIDFEFLSEKVLELQRSDRKENQILYYTPASEKAELIHRSQAKYVGCSGGNRSGKTCTVLAHIVSLSTGCFPLVLHDVFEKQFRGPINSRVVIESFKTVLHPIMLPKLQWWKWSGVDRPGGDRGHWGLVPRHCLQHSSWEKSWSEKNCILRVLCRDPDNQDHVLGESTIQFCSKDQDDSDFASGTFHIVMHDEPPMYRQWKENEARTMEVGGRMFLTFTWPDDPTIPVDWIYDSIYDKAHEPNKSPNHDWFQLSTLENKNLDQEFIAEQAAEWSEETRNVRLYGGSIRFSNSIHPDFTESTRQWCFSCARPSIGYRQACGTCGQRGLIEYNHVIEFDYEKKGYPVVFLLDPHPRKPHMFLWCVIDPIDDIYVLAEGELAGTPVECAELIFDMEEKFNMNVVLRLIDPNMGLSVAGIHRETTWQDAFAEAKILCDLSDDAGVGIQKINEYFKPDRYTLKPRLFIHQRCRTTIHQIKRYAWAEHKHTLERDVKQVPQSKNSDYPTLLKYLLNSNPVFKDLQHGYSVIKGKGHRKGAY